MDAHAPKPDVAGLIGTPRAFMTDLARCLRFYSRLPVPRLPWEDDPHALPDFLTMPRALPLAGLIVGLIGALALGLARGLGPYLAATITVTVLALATGAFHEDGLADTADGFGGGRDPAHRLTIMKDSRIGTFGGAALILALALRIGGIAALMQHLGTGAAACAIIAAAALSRTAGLVPLAVLPPARFDGASAAVGRPSPVTMTIAGAFALAIVALAALAGGLPGSGIVNGLIGAGIMAGGMSAISQRLIGGQTGDVAGAVQQLAEIAFLLALVASAS